MADTQTCRSPPFPDLDFGRAKKLEAASRWLWAYLSAQPNHTASSFNVKFAAHNVGIKSSTLSKAKRTLGVGHYFDVVVNVEEEIFPNSVWSLSFEHTIVFGDRTYTRQWKPRRTFRKLTAKSKVTSPAAKPPVQPATNGNQAYKAKIGRDIEVVAHHLASRPWPGSARNARVMGTLLRRLGRQNKVTTKVNLWNFTFESGFAHIDSVKAALFSLEKDEWIKFTLGDPDQYEKGHWEPIKNGEPSVITLIRRSGDSVYPVSNLPNAARDEFARASLGTSGYLFVMRVLFDGRTEGLTRPDIERMTGLSRSTVQTLVKKATNIGRLYKSSGKWNVVDAEMSTEDGGDSKMQARIRMRKDSVKRQTAKRKVQQMDTEIQQASLKRLRDRMVE